MYMKGPASICCVLRIASGKARVSRGWAARASLFHGIMVATGDAYVILTCWSSSLVAGVGVEARGRTAWREVTDGAVLGGLSWSEESWPTFHQARQTVAGRERRRSGPAGVLEALEGARHSGVPVPEAFGHPQRPHVAPHLTAVG